jgi:hypothetical protein
MSKSLRIEAAILYIAVGLPTQDIKCPLRLSLWFPIKAVATVLLNRYVDVYEYLLRSMFRKGKKLSVSLRTLSYSFINISYTSHIHIKILFITHKIDTTH